MPTTAEIQGWARLVAGVADEGIAGTVQDMHRAISRGAFRIAGPIGRPVERLHDAVVDHVYTTVRTGIRAAGEIGAAIATLRPRHDSSATALRARSIALGSVDERFLSVAPELDAEVALYRDGTEIPAESTELAAAFPDASSHVTVFLHGLTQSENGWHPSEHDGVALPEVAAAAGATALLLRYGTGRAIVRNGADVAELLEAIVRSWPVTVERMTIVGHSMGGLVAQAAGLVARERRHRWPDVVTDLLHLGTPHRGSWLEKFATRVSWALARSSPHSAPIGRLIDGRSQGIKDLRFGTIAATGSGDVASDGDLIDLVEEPPFPGRNHHLVVGRLRSAQRHPLNLMLGDGLVRFGSASGLEGGTGESGSILPVDASHTRMLHHPEVGDLLRRLLRDA